MKIEHVKKMINSVGERLESDRDWMPTLIFETKGVATVIGMPVPMNDQTDRNIVANIITRTLREAKADGAVWITTAWSVDTRGMSNADQKELLRQGKAHTINKRPDKIEVVSAIIGNRDGKDDGNTVIIGRIIRSAGHPKVDWDWFRTPTDGKALFKGTFPEAVYEGIQHEPSATK